MVTGGWRAAPTIRGFYSRYVLERFMNEHTRRNSLRLQGYDYLQPGLYFITICTHKGEMMFGEISDGRVVLTEYGKAAETQLLKSAGIWNVVLDAYVIMPNHLHFIARLEQHPVGAACVGAACQPPAATDRSKQIIPAMLCRYKGSVTKDIGFSLWQRSYYDNIIHNKEEYEAVKHYIQNNPATWEKDRFYCKDKSIGWRM